MPSARSVQDTVTQGSDGRTGLWDWDGVYRTAGQGMISRLASHHSASVQESDEQVRAFAVLGSQALALAQVRGSGIAASLGGLGYMLQPWHPGSV